MNMVFSRRIRDKFSEGQVKERDSLNGKEVLCDGTILRLKKTADEVGHEIFSVKDEWAFIESIIAPLVGGELVPHWTVSEVNVPFLVELAKDADKVRPLERRHKGIDFQRTTAALCKDATMLNEVHTSTIYVTLEKLSDQNAPIFDGECICLELKPKISPPVHFEAKSTSTETCNIFCRFCLQQKKKRRTSLYCPFQFLETDNMEDNIVNALESLWLYPSNNLKLFVNGEPVLDWKLAEKGKSIFIKSVAAILAKERIIERFFELQRIFGESPGFDASQVESLWEGSDRSISFKNIDVTQLRNLIPELKSDPGNQDAKAKALLVYSYLLSRTLADCSLMVSFSLKLDEAVRDAIRVEYNVAIVDLDPKFPTKIKAYAKDDEALLNCCGESLQCKLNLETWRKLET